MLEFVISIFDISIVNTPLFGLGKPQKFKLVPVEETKYTIPYGFYTKPNKNPRASSSSRITITRGNSNPFTPWCVPKEELSEI